MHTHALHTDAGADGVDVFVAAGDGDLRALAGLTRRGADLHRAVVDFRDFHLEQALHQHGIRARHDHLRALRRAVHDPDDDAHAVAHVVGFQARLLALRQARFRAAHVHDQVRAFGPLDDTGDKLADAVVILVEDGVAFGFAHLLQDHLLGGLRRDASQHIGRPGGENFRADFGGRI